MLTIRSFISISMTIKCNNLIWYSLLADLFHSNTQNKTFILVYAMHSTQLFNLLRTLLHTICIHIYSWVIQCTPYKYTYVTIRFISSIYSLTFISVKKKKQYWQQPIKYWSIYSDGPITLSCLRTCMEKHFTRCTFETKTYENILLWRPGWDNNFYKRHTKDG